MATLLHYAVAAGDLWNFRIPAKPNRPEIPNRMLPGSGVSVNWNPLIPASTELTALFLE